MKKIALFVIFTILLTLLIPGLSLARQPTDIECEEDYTVQANDWLSKITEKYLGDVLAYPVIVKAANVDANDSYTDIIDPNLIEPGWILCIPSDEDMAKLTGTNTTPVPAGLSLPELANATYSSEWTQDKTTSLTNGEYHEPAASGSATEIKVIMLTEQTTYGQLNGQDVAAVMLVTDPGGSGTFYYLYLMASQNGQPTEVANTLLGDRVQINLVSIENNGVVVDMVQSGPDDPLCCPSQQVIKILAWRDEKLVETSSRVIDSETAGTKSSPVRMIWKWLGSTDRAGQNDIVVPNPDNYRLELLGDGTFRAKADCNIVSGLYVLRGNRLTFENARSTMAVCGPGSLYYQYLFFFGQVVGYEQNGHNLVLSLAADGGSMNFSKLQAVTGTIIGPVDATLPAGATLDVKVMDVTEGAPGTQIGGVLQDITTFPIEFEADYNPRAVVPSNIYALNVTVQDGQGNTLYQNTPYPTLTQGNPTFSVLVVVESMK
ncbi:YbaY family lipoprotein [Chloroflexota bacterium]